MASKSHFISQELGIMSDSLIGNLLIIQHGCNSVVSNAILSGIVTEALNSECIQEILGSINGIQGLTLGNFIDLASEQQQTMLDLQHSAGAILGTHIHGAISTNDLENMLNQIEKNNIRFIFNIGAQEAQTFSEQIALLATENNYELRVIGLPETIENNLPITDHCLGYGSAIKLLATALQESSNVLQSSGLRNAVEIFEIGGHDPSWLVAGSVLARKVSQRNAPHLIYLPTTTLNNDVLLDQVSDLLKSSNFCTIVTASRLTDDNGNPIATNAASAADAIKNAIIEELDVHATIVKLETLLRGFSVLTSAIDLKEAIEAGSKAVEFSLNGANKKMLTLLRADASKYSVEYGLADLSNIVGRDKPIPPNWLSENHEPTTSFIKYASQLIQGESAQPFVSGLPKSISLKKIEFP
ncbi:MAG: 6-phosphofructokinase [Puniceicoccales bacterium]|jgi:6-phosphofructokinase 1|nr:6-phosphofructokinase [Puniceicoccales bacterium]